MTARDPDIRLAQRLVREGRIPEGVAEAALLRKANRDLRFEDALLELGFGEAQLLRLLAEVYRTQFITTEKLAKINVSERTLRLVPKALAERRLVVPLSLDTEQKLLVVTPDPESLDLIKDVLIASQVREVKALVARPLAVRAAISRHYDGDQSAFTALAPTSFFEDSQPITDSQSSFALFHSQSLGVSDAPASTRPGAQAPSAGSSTGPRSQPAMRRPPSLTSLRAAGPVQQIEPPRLVSDEIQEPTAPIEASPRLEAIEPEDMLEEIEPEDMLEEIEPDLLTSEILKSSPLRKTPARAQLGVSRVSSLPPPAEPDELEVVDDLIGESSLIADPLSFVEALVSLHERGRRHLRDHSALVAQLSANFCSELGLSPQERLEAKLAGLIHDLGKSRIHHLTAYNVGLSADYERLARQEYASPTLLLKRTGLPLTVITAVNHMYERYDGQGFPSGLQSEEIPLLSRIVALADSYADLTRCSANAFQRLLSPEEALAALRSHPLSIFDPAMLETLASLLNEAEPVSAFAEG